MPWTSLDELDRVAAELAGRHEAIARVLGEAARSASDPARAPLTAAHAAQHAWHAELWRARRPVLPGRPAAEPSAPVVSADADEVYRDVLPALAAELADRRAATDDRLDAPTARVLDLVLADLRAQLALGPG